MLIVEQIFTYNIIKVLADLHNVKTQVVKFVFYNFMKNIYFNIN